jgi:hypothetical protein
MINKYLQYIQESVKPDVLYHAASELTKTIIPRKSKIGHTGKMKKHSYVNKSWEKKAVFSATTKLMCYPFGLERINMMWPGNHTEEEVNSWTKACYLSTGKNNILKVYYWNYTPIKPFYLYYVDPKDFKLINDSPGAAVEQWYCTKEVIPLKIEKIYPNQIKKSWERIGDKDWEIKKQKYKTKGFFK